MAAGSRGDLRDEAGGIITGWLLQVVIFLAIIALIGYEAISIAVTAINLEDDARDVARAAAQAFDASQRIAAAREAAQATADELNVTLVSVEESEGVVSAAVQKQADTLFVHNVGLFDSLVVADATGRARWR